jgi:hypothetical protein
MKKNRYLLYLLLTAFMIYFAMPRISFNAGGKEALFAGSWIFLALLVFAGNLAAFLYTPRKDYGGGRGAIGAKTRKKSRMFTG